MACHHAPRFPKRFLLLLIVGGAVIFLNVVRMVNVNNG